MQSVKSVSKKTNRNQCLIRAFSLIEILIVVSVLGILTAIVFPHYQNQAQLAKESAAKENLRILRSAIERYTFEHNDVPPGYANGSPVPVAVPLNQLIYCSNLDGETNGKVPTDEYIYGPYLSDSVINLFNNRTNWGMVTDSSITPTGTNGWLYNPITREIRIDWPGTDSQGTEYADY